MRNVKGWGILVVALSIIGAIVGALMTGEKSPMFASGSISLAEELKDDARGIRSLFIVVHDADSTMPMPYGAVRERVKEDAKGEFFKFFLTKERLQTMNPNADHPQFLRIKARLDIDGTAGVDQPGDLFGTIDRVPFGAEGVKIVIDQKAP